MKRIYNIDVLKFLLAVLVVFLHVHTPYQEYIQPLTRCAVPCFFIISGYLIFADDKLKFENKLKSGIIKIFRIFVWSNLFFAMIRIFQAFKDNDFSFLNFEAFAKFFLLNESPFGFHLWYIGAYLYTLIIVLFLTKNNRLNYAYWAILPLLIVDLCFGKYSLVLWKKEFSYILVRNFICVGLPYFSIGMLIKHLKEKVLCFNYLQIFTLGGVIFLTSLMEKKLLVELNLNATRDNYISSTFLAISLFLLFLSTKQTKVSILSALGEKDSLYIYIFHPLFMMLFSFIIRYFSNSWQETYLYCAPVIILVVTIIFSKSLRILRIVK